MNKLTIRLFLIVVTAFCLPLPFWFVELGFPVNPDYARHFWVWGRNISSTLIYHFWMYTLCLLVMLNLVLSLKDQIELNT